MKQAFHNKIVRITSQLTHLDSSREKVPEEKGAREFRHETPWHLFCYFL
jgi:hypothetical protein